MVWMLFYVPAGLSIAITTATGLRMLWLARRTRGAPELTYGLSLVIFALTNIIELAVYAQRSALVYGVYLASYCLGAVIAWMATWQVFRPNDRWMRNLCGVVTAALAAGYGYQGVVERFDLSRVQDLNTPAQWLVRIATASAILWTAGESLRCHFQYKRRARFGLVDRAAPARMLLWAASAGSFAVVILTALAHAGGLVTLDVADAVQTFFPPLGSVTIWLTFFPPARLQRLLAGRNVPP